MCRRHFSQAFFFGCSSRPLHPCRVQLTDLTTTSMAQTWQHTTSQRLDFPDHNTWRSLITRSDYVIYSIKASTLLLSTHATFSTSSAALHHVLHHADSKTISYIPSTGAISRSSPRQELVVHTSPRQEKYGRLLLDRRGMDDFASTGEVWTTSPRQEKYGRLLLDR